MNLVDQLLSTGVELTKDLVVKKIVEFIATKAAFLLVGPLGWLVKAAVKAAVTYLIFPAIEDLIGESAYLIRKAKLAQKVKTYQEAQTDEEINNAFDALISGS